ncbi:damage-inducible protein, partial [Acinetobacter baumannii]
AVTRWQVSVRPSVPLPVQGVGRAQWLLELTRCRSGETAQFEVEASDAEGRIAFSSRLADRSLAAVPWRLGASA